MLLIFGLNDVKNPLKTYLQNLRKVAYKNVEIEFKKRKLTMRERNGETPKILSHKVKFSAYLS